MKIIAFAASNHSESINKALVIYAASLLPSADIELLDLNDFEMPIYSQDREKSLGIPDAATSFFTKLGEADAFIISFAEHNGSYTAAYKNLFDWTSRIDMKVFQGKPSVYLSTSPGPGGAASVLSTAINSAHFFATEVKASLSIPNFYDNFDLVTKQLTNAEIDAQLRDAVSCLVS